MLHFHETPSDAPAQGRREKKKAAEEAAVLWEAHSGEEMNTWRKFRLY